MNVWFGTDWGALVNRLTPQVPVPIGAACLWCEEAIAEGDSGWGQCEHGPWTHLECFMRQMAGSVAHQLKVCSCFGGEDEGESADVSRREHARAAYDLQKRLNALHRPRAD